MVSRAIQRWIGTAGLVFAMAVCCRAAATAEADKAKDEGYPAVTFPDGKNVVKIAFKVSGVVAKVYVQPGATVKVGQQLVDLDTREEEKELEFLRIEAESDVPIHAAEKERDLKAATLARKAEGRKQNAPGMIIVADQEWEEAKADAEIALLKVAKAKQDQQQAKVKRDKQEILISNMKLVSSVDGIVEKVELVKGELAVPDPNKPVLTIVRNEVFWVEAHLPVAVAQALSKDMEIGVRYPGEPYSEKPVRTGKIIFFAPLADAASGTQMVRLALPNKEGRSSGLRVLIDLPAEARAKMPKMASVR